MTIRQSLQQMVTAQRPQTADGHPERGDVIVIDGVECTVTSSAQVAGSLVIYAMDADRREHVTRRPM
jgi:hypothetical protein